MSLVGDQTLKAKWSQCTAFACLLFMMSRIFTFVRISNDYIRTYNTLVVNNTGSNNQTKPLFDMAFIHIPKTGGSFIENVLKKEYNILPGYSQRHNILTPNIIKSCPQWHIPLTWIMERSQYNLSLVSPYYSRFKNLTTNSFTVVRNPYNRFLSEYQYRTANNYHGSVTKSLFKFFIKYCQIYIQNNTYCTNLIEIKKKSSFIYDNNNSIWNNFNFCNVNNFNIISNVILNYLIEGKLIEGLHNYTRRASLGCHLVPQNEFVFDYNNNNKQIIGNILKTETLPNDFVELVNRYRHPNDVKMNVSFINKYNKWHWKKNCKQLKINSLNHINKQLLFQFYEKDFLYFNYSQ